MGLGPWERDPLLTVFLGLATTENLTAATISSLSIRPHPRVQPRFFLFNCKENRLYEDDDGLSAQDNRPVRLPARVSSRSVRKLLSTLFRCFCVSSTLDAGNFLSRDFFLLFLRRVTTPMRSRFNVVFINGRKWKDVYREMLTSWRIFARFVQISIKIGLLKTSPRLRPVVYRTEFVSSPFLSSPVFYAYGAKWPN